MQSRTFIPNFIKGKGTLFLSVPGGCELAVWSGWCVEKFLSCCSSLLLLLFSQFANLEAQWVYNLKEARLGGKIVLSVSSGNLPVTRDCSLIIFSHEYKPLSWSKQHTLLRWQGSGCLPFSSLCWSFWSALF